MYQPSINELLKSDNPVIPPDIYLAQLEYWETNSTMFQKAKKIILYFTITDGQYAGVKLRAFYNAKKIIGRPRRNGQFKAGQMSKFAREFFIVLESMGIYLQNIRYDRLPVSHLVKTDINIRVRTVTEVQSKKLAQQVQYSVIDELLGK